MAEQQRMMGEVAGYARRVYGFALNRTGDRLEAEDLAQEIMLQLIRSIASGAKIHRMDAYVWTVARHTWANWIERRVIGREHNESMGILPEVPDPGARPEEDLIHTETVALLQREIAYLSETQRRIVTLHYYKGLKQTEVATQLGIPVGTVKWHLHEARNELKKGMERVRSQGQLSFDPIRLVGMGHSGQPGRRGDTSDFLQRSLTQNIVYAAYQRPLSIEEIARELGTSPPFIEDEVRSLIEYEFMAEVQGGKYQTNFVIWDETAEQSMEIHELHVTSASEIAALHFEALMDMRSDIEQTELYYPERDYNFLLWTLLPMNVQEQSIRAGQLAHRDLGERLAKVASLRPDGGHYVAFARLQKEAPSDSHPDLSSYHFTGPMIRRNNAGLFLWQLNTSWSDRTGWRDLNVRDVELCHAFWNNELPDDDQHAEQYAFLMRQQYVVRKDGKLQFNAVWVNDLETGHTIKAIMPDLAREHAPIIERMYDAQVAIEMRNKPSHIRGQVEYLVWAKLNGGGLVPYVLKCLLDQGKLSLPQPHQRKTITTYMGVAR